MRTADVKRGGNGLRPKKKRSKWRTALLVTLLALVCVGGMELAVCRVLDPELYQRITGPVRQGVSELGAAVVALFPKPTPPAEDRIPEEQIAGAPALRMDNPSVAEKGVRLEERDGREVLLGGGTEIVYFNQADPQWKDLPYGRDDIGRYGCGPTAMAMAVSSLTDTETDPEQMAAWCAKQGYWVRRSGSNLAIVEGVAQAYGLECEGAYIPTEEELCQILAAGNIVVTLMTRGHFTEYGHFILLRGLTMGGEVLVADPNSRERSLVGWDPQLILDELSASRNAGAPVWILSAPERHE